jgi:hypothetical protein
MSIESQVSFVPFSFSIEDDAVAVSLPNTEPIILMQAEEPRSVADIQVELGRSYYLARPIAPKTADLTKQPDRTNKRRIGYLKSEIDRAYDAVQ